MGGEKGINGINYFSPTIFKSIGIVGTNTSLLTTGVFGVIKAVGALIWCFLIIDRFGRRGVLLVGSVGEAVGMFVIAAYISIAAPQLHPTTVLPPGKFSSFFFRFFFPSVFLY